MAMKRPGHGAVERIIAKRKGKAVKGNTKKGVDPGEPDADDVKAKFKKK